MKRFISFLATVLFIASIGLASEHKQYNSTMPDCTYFVSQRSSSDVLAVTNTNNEIEMWFPTKVFIYNTTATLTTGTLTHVKVIPTFQIAPDTVTTNESGTVSTNHFHGAITNTTYAYLTNLLCTITNPAGANMKIADVDLSNIYIQKGDLLVWSLGMTNHCWLGITGKR